MWSAAPILAAGTTTLSSGQMDELWVTAVVSGVLAYTFAVYSRRAIGAYPWRVPPLFWGLFGVLLPVLSLLVVAVARLTTRPVQPPAAGPYRTGGFFGANSGTAPGQPESVGAGAQLATSNAARLSVGATASGPGSPAAPARAVAAALPRRVATAAAAAMATARGRSAAIGRGVAADRRRPGWFGALAAGDTWRAGGSAVATSARPGRISAAGRPGIPTGATSLRRSGAAACRHLAALRWSELPVGGAACATGS